MSTRLSAKVAASAEFGSRDDANDQPALRDLAEVTMNAGRKRRILSEALDRHERRRRSSTLVAALAGLAAACSGLAMRLDWGSWVYLLPAVIVLACCSGGSALLCLILDRRDRPDVLAGDAAVCDLLVRHLRILHEHNVGADLGDRLLTGIETELKAIGERHRRLDGAEFVGGRRHQRFAMPDTIVTCTLRSGERRIATIRDLSRSGVALGTDLTLAPGTVVTIGSTPARAVRRTPDGMAFEFLRPFPREGFSRDVVL